MYPEYESAHLLNILYRCNKQVAYNVALTTPGLLTAKVARILKDINENAAVLYTYLGSGGNVTNIIKPLIPESRALALSLLRQLADDIVPISEITPPNIIKYTSETPGRAPWEYANTLNILYMKNKEAAAALVNPDAWGLYVNSPTTLTILNMINPHAEAFYSSIRSRTMPSDLSLRAQLLDDLKAVTAPPTTFGGYRKRTTRRKNKRTKSTQSTKRIIVIKKRKTRQVHRKPMKTRVTIKKKK